MFTDLEVDNYFKSKEFDASTSFVKFKVKKTTLLLTSGTTSENTHTFGTGHEPIDHILQGMV